MDPWSNTATDTGNYPYLSFFLSLSISIFLCHSVSLFLILSLSHHSTRFNILSIPLYSRKNKKIKKKQKWETQQKKNRPRIQQVQVARPHESHTVLLNVVTKTLRTLSFLFPFFFFLSFNSTRATIRRSSNVRARISFQSLSKYVYRNYN